MFDSPTTFVIGAGAGCDIGMPTGKELLSAIEKDLDIRTDDFQRTVISGSRAILSAIRAYAQKNDKNSVWFNSIDNAAKAFVRAAPQAISIDNYIDNHSADEATRLLGKLAIVNSIAEFEARSKLYFTVENSDSNFSFRTISSTWFNHFWKKACEGARSLEEFMNSLEKVKFINFNYDRCLEHFFINSIRSFWRVTEATAAEVASQLTVIHPYGSLGPLPWEVQSGGYKFGIKPNDEFLLNSFPRIQTFTEQTTSKFVLESVVSAIKESESVIFLGFAFHEQNMKLLTPNFRTEIRRIFGTATGISTSDLTLIHADVRNAFQSVQEQKIFEIRNNLDCAGLFQEFGRSLGRSN